MRALFVRLLATFAVLCLEIPNTGATEARTNPITGYLLTVMPPNASGTKFFGWIELVNGNQDAGYINLDDGPPVDPTLVMPQGYIVTQMPFASLPLLLQILRNEKQLQIRFFDPQSPGIHPSVFLETGQSNTQFPESAFHLNPEMTKRVNELLQAH
jgi:hypothetical protein